MEFDAAGKAVEVAGNSADWNTCPSPPNNNQPINNSGTTRRMLDFSPHRGLTVNPLTTGKFITLTKKKITENVQVRPFDDGLYYLFDKLIKPKHISFYCKTDNEAVESCDFRLFHVNKADT